MRLKLLGGTALAGLLIGGAPALADPLPAGCVFTAVPTPSIDCPTGYYTDAVISDLPDTTITIGAGSVFDVASPTPILIYSDYSAPIDLATIQLGDRDADPVTIYLNGENAVGAGIDSDWYNSPVSTIRGHVVVDGYEGDQNGLSLYTWGDAVLDAAGAINLWGPFSRGLVATAEHGTVDIGFEGDVTVGGGGGFGVFAARDYFNPATNDYIEGDIIVDIDGDLIVNPLAANAFADNPNKQPVWRGSTGIMVDNGWGGASVSFGDIDMRRPDDGCGPASVCQANPLADPSRFQDATGLLIAATGDVFIDGGDITVEADTSFAVNVGPGVRQRPFSLAGVEYINASLGDISVTGSDSQGVWLRADRIDASIGDITLDVGDANADGYYATGLYMGVGHRPNASRSRAAFGDMTVNGANAYGVKIAPIYQGSDVAAELEFGSITINPGEGFGVGISYRIDGFQTPDMFGFPASSTAFLNVSGDVAVDGFGAGLAAGSAGDVLVQYQGDMTVGREGPLGGPVFGIINSASELAATGNNGTIFLASEGTGIFTESSFDKAEVFNSGIIDALAGGFAVQAIAGGGNAEVSNSAGGIIAGAVDLVGNAAWLGNEGLWLFTGSNAFSGLAGGVLNSGTMDLARAGTASFYNGDGAFVVENSGLISSMNGIAGDIVAFDGQLRASAGSMLALDVRFGGAASQADLFRFTQGTLADAGGHFGPTTVDVAAEFSGVYGDVGAFVPLIDGAGLDIGQFAAAAPVIADGLLDWTWTQEAGALGYRSSENADRAAAAGRLGMTAGMMISALTPAAFGTGGTAAGGGGSPAPLGYGPASPSGPEFPINEAATGRSLHASLIGGRLSDAAGDSGDLVGLIGGVDIVAAGPDGLSGHGVFGGALAASLDLAGGATGRLSTAGLGARARMSSGGWFAQLTAQAGAASLEAGAGGVSDTATGWYGSVEARFGKRFDAASGSGLYLEPVLTLAATHLDVGALSVAGAPLDADSSSFSAGGALKAGAKRVLANGWTMDAFVSGGAVHTTASGTDLVGATAISGSADGLTGTAGLGLSLSRPDGGLLFTAGVDGRFGEQRGLTASAGLSVKFGG